MTNRFRLTLAALVPGHAITALLRARNDVAVPTGSAVLSYWGVALAAMLLLAGTGLGAGGAWLSLLLGASVSSTCLAAYLWKEYAAACRLPVPVRGAAVPLEPALGAVEVLDLHERHLAEPPAQPDPPDARADAVEHPRADQRAERRGDDRPHQRHPDAQQEVALGLPQHVGDQRAHRDAEEAGERRLRGFAANEPPHQDQCGHPQRGHDRGNQSRHARGDDEHNHRNRRIDDTTDPARLSQQTFGVDAVSGDVFRRTRLPRGCPQILRVGHR